MRLHNVGAAFCCIICHGTKRDVTCNIQLITTLAALLDLAVFKKQGNSNHWLFCFPLSKLYTVSLMSTLNARRGHADALKKPIEAINLASNDQRTDVWGFKINLRSSIGTLIGVGNGSGEVVFAIF